MAKFTGKNIEFKDGQKATFGDADDSSIFWSGDNSELTITTVVSGVDPTAPGHLTTKFYVDTALATISGGGSNEFTGLTDTPSDYTNSAGYVVSVNSSEDGLEFTSPGSYNIDGGFANSVYGGVPALDGGAA
jgi:hypothetical protein